MGEIVRLQKYIAMSGAASRRAAETMISEGRVSVNGKTVAEQGVKVEIGCDRVSLDGVELRPTAKKYYIMLNKPAGCVSTVSDQFGRPTVTDLVKKDINTRIFPVGRLDYETEGLLLMTNDGEFTYRITHPKYNVKKTYIAEIKGGVSPSDMNRLRKGIRLDNYTTAPAEAEILDAINGYTLIRLTIHEGKNREVRRMFEALGHEVSALKRVSIGEVELGNLPPGRWRYLTKHEINCLLG